MKKITITNADNTRLQVELIRYFKFKNDCFLIYTLGELDEKNYQKLYLVKIMEELGLPVVININDEAEWAGMQNIVKKVIKEIKSGKYKLLEDLDYNSIDGIKVVNPRFFKLDSKLVQILSSNYFEDDNIEQNDYLEITVEPINNVEEINPTVELSNEGVQPIIEPIPVPIVEPIKEEQSVVPIQPIIESIAEPINETIVEQPINPVVVPIVESVNGPVLENQPMKPIESSNSVQESKKQEIDYKALYLVEKRDNEATSAAMEEILDQLVKYKEKYGEL